MRTAAYNQLCALTATFDLKIEGQLLETQGLCIPSNNTIFIKAVSAKLAINEPHLTLEFLEECIQGFQRSTIELKHLCLEYMTPWLQNLVRLVHRILVVSLFSKKSNWCSLTFFNFFYSGSVNRVMTPKRQKYLKFWKN